jgi:hypothetical protein
VNPSLREEGVRAPPRSRRGKLLQHRRPSYRLLWGGRGSGGYENRQQHSGGLQSTGGAGGVNLSALCQGTDSRGARDVRGKRPHATASDGRRDGPPAATIPKGPSRGLCSLGRSHGQGRVHGALWSHHLLLLDSGAGALLSRKCVRLPGL